MDIIFTAKFLREYSKLDADIQSDVVKAVEDFKDSNNHKKLKLHTLHGKYKQYHSFYFNFYYRVVIKIEKGVVYAMKVGVHDVYK